MLREGVQRVGLLRVGELLDRRCTFGVHVGCGDECVDRTADRLAGGVAALHGDPATVDQTLLRPCKNLGAEQPLQ